MRAGLLEEAVTVSVSASLAGARGNAGEVDGLQAGTLVDGDVGQRVQRGRLVDRVDGDREGAGDDVVARAAIVDGDGDGGGAEGEGRPA